LRCGTLDTALLCLVGRITGAFRRRNSGPHLGGANPESVVAREAAHGAAIAISSARKQAVQRGQDPPYRFVGGRDGARCRYDHLHARLLSARLKHSGRCQSLRATANGTKGSGQSQGGRQSPAVSHTTVSTSKQARCLEMRARGCPSTPNYQETFYPYDWRDPCETPVSLRPQTYRAPRDRSDRCLPLMHFGTAHHAP